MSEERTVEIDRESDTSKDIYADLGRVLGQIGDLPGVYVPRGGIEIEEHGIGMAHLEVSVPLTIDRERIERDTDE